MDMIPHVNKRCRESKCFCPSNKRIARESLEIFLKELRPDEFVPDESLGWPTKEEVIQFLKDADHELSPSAKVVYEYFKEEING